MTSINTRAFSRRMFQRAQRTLNDGARRPKLWEVVAMTTILEAHASIAARKDGDEKEAWEKRAEMVRAQAECPYVPGDTPTALSVVEFALHDGGCIHPSTGLYDELRNDSVGVLLLEWSAAVAEINNFSNNSLNEDETKAEALRREVESEVFDQLRSEEYDPQSKLFTGLYLLRVRCRLFEEHQRLDFENPGSHSTIRQARWWLDERAAVQTAALEAVEAIEEAMAAKLKQ